MIGTAASARYLLKLQAKLRFSGLYLIPRALHSTLHCTLHKALSHCSEPTTQLYKFESLSGEVLAGNGTIIGPVENEKKNESES